MNQDEQDQEGLDQQESGASEAQDALEHGRDEGEYVADLIFGRNDPCRFDAPEPSLLPHLAAHLCHDFSIPQVLQTTREFGLRGSLLPPYPPLFEAVVWGLAARQDLQQLNNIDSADANHVDVVRALQTRDTSAAQRIFEQAPGLGFDYPAQAAVSRVAPLLRPAQVRSLRDDPQYAPNALDAESVRSLLVAFAIHGLEVDKTWLDAAVNGLWGAEYQFSRRMHILPELPNPRQKELADQLAQRICEMQPPAFARALWVRRVAPFVSTPAVWQRGLLLADLESTWRAHIEACLRAPWTDEPWADVFGAHPASDAFRNVKRPHETTHDASVAIEDRWLGAPAMVSPAEEAQHRGLNEPDRRLQTDVSLLPYARAVDSFVAGVEHRLDISIGHDGRIRADRALDETLFEDSDGEAIELSVVFHAGDFLRQGKIVLPRNRSMNSSIWSINYTPPQKSTELSARLYVLRPNSGLLLLSGLLRGTVVADVAGLANVDNGLSLTIDVITADSHNPPQNDPGEVLVTDGDSLLGGLAAQSVCVNTALLQSQLAALVNAIETAATRQEFDVDASGEMLVELAQAGQALRTDLADVLDPLLSEPFLQIVSLRESDVLPLELVYDGPALSLNSTICPNWQDALRAGHCDDCGDAGNDDPAKVCPLNFWAMKKVIERRTSSTDEETFLLSSERSADRNQLRRIESVVVAASGRVADAHVEQVRAAAANSLAAVANTATDWTQWLAVVNDTHPELLIAMPHNETTALRSMLMLGEPQDGSPPANANALLRGSVSQQHIQTTSDDPGPIVLLLGCNTQYKASSFGGFVGEFHQQGAALSVGTIGKLMADQAPQAAEVIVQELAAAPSGATMGEVLLNARRRLLSDGMIMSLLLVGNGDAHWTLPH